MITPTHDTLVMVFAKAPTPGTVKTRLIPALGERGAAQLYRNMLHHTLVTLTQLDGVDRQLHAVPDPDDACLNECARRYNMVLHEQNGHDLGERMANAFVRGLQSYAKVIVVGCDCPALAAPHYREVMSVLQGKDSVIIPARDGGYVLLGLRRFAPALFEDIDWSTDKVFAQTQQRLADADFSWQALPALPDIDRPADLQYCPQKLLNGVTHEVVG